MFRNFINDAVCSDEEYEIEAEQLRLKVFNAQRQCIQRKIPLLIMIAGVPLSGRGSVINLLSEWMDGKFVRTFVFWMETDEEKFRPKEWKYWRCMPQAGSTAVYLDGWYGEALRDLCRGKIKKDFNAAMAYVRDSEDALASYGMAIAKIWLHLDKHEYKRRMKKHDKDKHTHLTTYDKKILTNYDEYTSAAATAISITDSALAPWSVVNAADRNSRNLAIGRSIVAAVERAIAVQDAFNVAKNAGEVMPDLPRAASALNHVDLTLKADPETYSDELDHLQATLHELGNEAYHLGISTTILFEGWDAAGKGGAIRRLQRGFDARITRVFPIGSPSQEELEHHYLWRFWRHIPRAGFVTIYDRTWYGRVLVERVEKLTPKCVWKNAYSEINTFERQLVEGGNLVLKFWLHISPEEQLRRFKEREATPAKQYKITPDDWRNRDKWGDYEVAAAEMFSRTDTAYAPWHIIAAEDKKYARLEVLRTVVDALKHAIKAKKKATR